MTEYTDHLLKHNDGDDDVDDNDSDDVDDAYRRMRVNY